MKDANETQQRIGTIANPSALGNREGTKNPT